MPTAGPRPLCLAESERTGWKNASSQCHAGGRLRGHEPRAAGRGLPHRRPGDATALRPGHVSCGGALAATEQERGRARNPQIAAPRRRLHQGSCREAPWSSQSRSLVFIPGRPPFSSRSAPNGNSSKDFAKGSRKASPITAVAILSRPTSLATVSSALVQPGKAPQ